MIIIDAQQNAEVVRREVISRIWQHYGSLSRNEV
jgi:hypothetical protein